MPPIIPDAPWLINAIVIMIAVTIAPVATWLSTRSRLRKTQQDVAVVRTEVRNSHSPDANLRDDVDHLKTAASRQERYLTDLDRSLRAVGHSLDRRFGMLEDSIAEAVEDRHTEIEALREDITSSLTDHSLECPARKLKLHKDNHD